jgi:hypothetical protein
VSWGTPIDVEAGSYEYSNSTLVAAANVFSTFVSSLLPTTAILVLHFISNDLARLGALIAFTAVFSLALSIFAKARRIDTFVATAT